MSHKPPLYSYIHPPHWRLSSPDRILTDSDFEALRLVVEDVRYVTREVTEDLSQVASEIRARSTILRRLLCERDLFNVGKFLPPDDELHVRARMLDFDPLHPAVIISCGNCPWTTDWLPGIASQLSINGVEPMHGMPWSYRENADVSLTEYLDGLAMGVLGIGIRRRELVKYVADKKAAHVSDRRKHDKERALDRCWFALSTTIRAPSGAEVRLNVVYLEILSLIRAMTDSPSIRDYIEKLASWLSTAQYFFPEGIRPVGVSFQMEPRA